MLLRCLPWVGAGTVRAAYTSSCFAPRAHACGGVFWSKPARLARSKIINRSIEGGRRPHPIRPTDASQPRSTIDRQAQSPSVRLPLGLGSRGRKEMQDDGGGPGRRRRVFWLLRAARVARATPCFDRPLRQRKRLRILQPAGPRQTNAPPQCPLVNIDRQYAGKRAARRVLCLPSHRCRRQGRPGCGGRASQHGGAQPGYHGDRPRPGRLLLSFFL